MRSWGRVDNVGAWQKVETDARGHNDIVYVTTLAQVLLLSLGESPFHANYGIPAAQSVQQQIHPDFYVAFTQQRFAKYFASLTISKRPGITPIYDIRVITNSGVRLNVSVPIPI